MEICVRDVASIEYALEMSLQRPGLHNTLLVPGEQKAFALLQRQENGTDVVRQGDDPHGGIAFRGSDHDLCLRRVLPIVSTDSLRRLTNAKLALHKGNIAPSQSANLA